MKSYVIVLLMFFSISSFAQSTLIPDPNFEQALISLNIDSDGLNGSILNSDAQQILNLDISGSNISDLSGIEAFTNLQNLYCWNNQLANLDLSNNTMLEGVLVTNNQLESINLSGLSQLNSINLSYNQLDSLDFSSNPSLNTLICWSNGLTYLNVENNFSLSFLSLSDNNLSGTFDISNHSLLEHFYCDENNIDSIAIIALPNVAIFNCRNNTIKSLDLSASSLLLEVHVDSNDLHLLNVKNSNNATITSFHAEGNPNLDCIQVDDALYSNGNSQWVKDFQSYYAEDCSPFAMLVEKGFSISLMPNPCTDHFKVSLDNSGFHTYRIHSYDGKLLGAGEFHGENKEFKTDLFSNGVYILVIQDLVTQFTVNR